MLLTATPLLFTGLAVAVAFRAGYYNIGAEGQFLARRDRRHRARALPRRPAGRRRPAARARCGRRGGGVAWALAAGLAASGYAGIDEVVTTLLLNPVALLLLQGLLNGPWRNPESGFPDSDRRSAPGYALPTLLGGDRVHAGLLIAHRR